MPVTISVLAPHIRRNGATVTAMMLSMALAETKRRVFLTHTSSLSDSFQTYMGLKLLDDKTNTSTQLVKLLREGALKPEDVADYCTKFGDYTDVFTNFDNLFTPYDMGTLLAYMADAESPYEYKVIDVDTPLSEDNASAIIAKSHIVVLNITPDFLELKLFKQWLKDNERTLRGKRLLLCCNRYDPVVVKKPKIITNFLEVKTPLHLIRENSWVRWGCNNGKLPLVFINGKNKNALSIDVYKGYMALSNSVVKLRNRILKSRGGV